MPNATSLATLPHPTAIGGFARADSRRRAGQRRPAFIAQALSYTLDAAILLLYHLAGITTLATSIAYLTVGLTTTGIALWLSEIHFNDRLRDHYLTVPLCVSSTTIQLGAIYLAPQIGFYFISLIFVILSFGALRMTARQTAIIWTYATLGLAALFLMTERPIAMPMASMTERALALACFVTALGRCASTGLYGSSMREMLYRRGNALKQANAKIEELAQIDELTGALNRRSIMRCLNDEIAKVERHASRCCVAIIDLDHFKDINDSFGHPVGDEVLRSFAIATFANIRSIDRFGRQGGEEFLLILPDTGQDDAVQTLDRLRKLITTLDWSAISNDLILTISAGLTAIRPNDTSEDVLARADRALYVAKAEGRNRVMAAPSRRQYS
jgi:diguanylate cyclase (GGDEF)-like protein